ncbi:uncharacterized protein LOC110028559 [Phalaenopsis equestris]|uniref:uncharacterized protein LOC110028559 n=1 Tax=Phalaenopsis equestris TaxID=78828 RepID=UPI0009E6089A|nr:uncharacterized protein LOC110028559 [Phalaenopsis equestris]
MFRHLKPQTRTLISPTSRSLPCFCSSSSSSSSPSPLPPDHDSSVDSDSLPSDRTETSGSSPTSPPSYTSYFSEIKERLKSLPAQPRRIPRDPPPPPAFSAATKSPPAASLEEIRKHLAEFRLKSGGSASGDRPSSGSPLSFQDLLKNNVFGKPSSSDGTTGPDAGKAFPFDSIRESLKKFRASSRETEGQARSSSFNIRAFQDGVREGLGESGRGPQLIGTDKLPDSIFGKERREKKGEGEEGESKVLRTEFVKMYGYEELGEKLQRLRPEKDGKKGEWFSLTELNERLAKLRELEEKETESKMGGVSIRDLRESLQRLKDSNAIKKANMQRFSLFTNLGRQGTQTFMLNPPQEHLVQNYFHPDHMSSGEKMKLELKKVRDEFKMSENDCGSTRVQIAQLTTKIKHLSSVLHKKDKHSRKGLNEMVQHRKKLLKYLRRTDWDSYCLVLSRLGLRDIPDYKIPEYKS